VEYFTRERPARVGWLADPPGAIVGGAELSAQDLAAQAPDWARVIPCPPWRIAEADVYVVQNCATYDHSTADALARAPVVKAIRDYWPHGDPALRKWLLGNARTLLFVSKPHKLAFEWPYALGKRVAMAPPPVDLERFRAAAKRAERDRGTLWIGQMFAHKGVDEAVAWARKHEELVDFYGDGPRRPADERFVRYRGQAPHKDVPALMARYRRFLYRPQWVEPYGKTVIEAWAAGLRLDVQGRVGALWWLEHADWAIPRAVELFWGEVWTALHIREGQGVWRRERA
jgi:hypothetical protein